MTIINKSRKIISVGGEPLLPGEAVELDAGLENSPAIARYLAMGVIVDANTQAVHATQETISDFERAKIAEEAVAKYKAEQEAIAKEQAAKDAEIKAVRGMKKAELLTKAAGMGLEVTDDESVDALREKIIAAISQ